VRDRCEPTMDGLRGCRAPLAELSVLRANVLADMLAMCVLHGDKVLTRARPRCGCVATPDPPGNADNFVPALCESGRSGPAEMRVRLRPFEDQRRSDRTAAWRLPLIDRLDAGQYNPLGAVAAPQPGTEGMPAALQTCVNLLPIGAYLTYLGVLHLRGRPYVTTGGWNYAALAFAVSGLVITGPIAFLSDSRFLPYVIARTPWAGVMIYLMIVALLFPRLYLFSGGSAKWLPSLPIADHWGLRV